MREGLNTSLPARAGKAAFNPFESIIQKENCREAVGENSRLRKKSACGERHEIRKTDSPNSGSAKLRLYINLILCGDAKAALHRLLHAGIDLIITPPTSPPYNFGYAYAHDPRDDTHGWNESLLRLERIWRECYRVIRPDSRISVSIQPHFSDNIPTHYIVSHQLARLGFLREAGIPWEKNNCIAKYMAWGSWKSLSIPYLKYIWEFIEVFDKESRRKPGQ
jgi:site-specific DNA-methyltransferase (adenine-specific)